MNKVILTGRFTKDPKSKLANNVEASTFRLACDNGYTDKKGNRDAEFIDCIAFNKTAEIINKYCKKGALISVQGRIKNTSYEKDGERKYSTRIVVEQIEFLNSPKESTPKEETPEDPYAAFGAEVNTADLPWE